VPYQLVGSTITFDVSRGMLGDPDGIVSYVLGIFRFGFTTDDREGISDRVTPTARSSWGRIKRLYR
jgi:hypothetical protein